MKIPASVRSLYSDQSPQYEKLKSEVDQILRPECSRMRWHYESRVKTEESLALKLESGRFANTSEVEDFFACTIVVRNLQELLSAESMVCKLFEQTNRRPKEDGYTHKAPEEFPFDDLRLYVRWKADPALPPKGVDGLLFEVQVKTFLQHAWGIATHDLVYKTDDVSWSKQRIAYQVKAMLEHAEISIQEADKLAAVPALAKKQRDTDNIRSIIVVLREFWESGLLPKDLRRLAENTRDVLALANMKVDEFKSLLEAEVARQQGDLPVNVSPYGIIVQAVAWQKSGALKKGLSDARKREKIFLADELELPDWLNDTTLVNVVRINKPVVPVGAP